MENMHNDVRVVRVKTDGSNLSAKHEKLCSRYQIHIFRCVNFILLMTNFLFIFNLLKQFISNFQVTGSGKTLAFLIPIVEMLLQRLFALLTL